MLLCVAAYPQTELDSLIKVAESAKGDSISIAYNAVGIHLTYSDPQNAFQYLEKALESARQYKNYKQQCVACSFMGTSSRYLGNYSKALRHFNDQLEVARSQNITDEIVWSNINLGNVMNYMKNYEIAKDYLETALREAQDLGDESIFQYVYVNLGRVNLLAKDYKQAINYHNMALNIRKQHPESPINIAVTYRDLGSAYFERKWFDSTKYYYGLSMAILDTLPNNAVKGSIYTNLAHIYIQERKPDSARIFSEAAVNCADDFSNASMKSEACLVMGHYLYSVGDFAGAEKYYSQRIAFNENLRSSDVQKQILATQNRSEHYKQEQQMLDEARTRSLQVKIGVVLLLTLLAGLSISIVLYFRRRHASEISRRLDFQTRLLESSIEYASKIQKAILPNFDHIVNFFSDKFLLFAPREEVSGDYYWHHDTDRYEMFAVAYTGMHGIPGGFMSMLGSSLLHMAVDKSKDPSDIISGLKRGAADMIGSDGFDSNRSRIDIGVMVIDKIEKTVYYSGTKSPLIYVRNGQTAFLQENNLQDSVVSKHYVTDKLPLQPGDVLYMMTYASYMQEGGADDAPFSISRLVEIIKDIHGLPMADQKLRLQKEFDDWRGSRPQKVDVTIAGFVFDGKAHD
ncbi:MAG: tetratricopeptide repeat protein [Bacteroidales bacterium]|nr:tetratricopeptide repeat protein [Bacteroidales bacterium]